MGIFNIFGNKKNEEDLSLNEANKIFAKRDTNATSLKDLKRRYGEGVEDFSQLTSGFGLYGSNEILGFNSFYKKYLDSSFKNEAEKLTEYRNIARYTEVSEVLEDIVYESTQRDTNGDLLKLHIVDSELEGNENIVKNLYNEFENLFYKRIDIAKKIDELLYTYYVDGKVFFEIVVDESKPKSGVQNIKKLPTETMDFSWNPVSGKYNFFVQYFKAQGKLPKSIEDGMKKEDLVVFYPKQIGYIEYGKYGFGGKKDIIGYLENARQPYNQLKLLETSIVIYRLVRAPERLVFKIDTGNMPLTKAMKFTEQMKQKLQKKVSYDPSTGKMTNSPNVLSMLENFFIPTSCLTLDTKISLLDGRDIPLTEVIDEFNSGKKNYVYSVDRKTGDIKHGEIQWAGITKKDQQIVRVHLDNGEYVDSTLDHKFILRNGEYCEAKDLKPNDSLMPYYTKNEKINKYDYKMVYVPSKNEYEFVHRIIEKPVKGNAIHHKDFNRFNNNPDNLESLSIKEHIKLHSNLNSYRWEHDLDYRNKMTNIKIEFWKNNEEYKKVLSDMKTQYFIDNPEKREELSILMKNKWKNEEFRNKAIKTLKERERTNDEKSRISKTLKAYFKTEQGKQQIQNVKDKFNTWWDNTDQDLHKKKISDAVNRSLELNGDSIRKKISEAHYKSWEPGNYPRLFEIICEEWKLNKKDKFEDFMTVLNNNSEFIEIWNTTHTSARFTKNKINKHAFDAILRALSEYKTFSDFKSRYVINHKVVRIEFLEDTQDVGCLTIKDPGDNHNFALSVGIFVKNSDGRGSSIESIGGNPSGFSELEDLYYFQRKLYRALKYPLSRIESINEKQSSNVLFSQGSGDIARDETKWGRFLKKSQDKFCDAFLDLFLTHLDFVGLSTEYNITKAKLNITLRPPNNYIQQMQQNEINQMWDNYSKTDHPEISKYWRMKKYLNMTDDEIRENAEGLKKDVELGLTPSDDSGY